MAAIAACVGLTASVFAPPIGSAAAAPTGGDSAATVIEKYQARIPQLMAEQDIPGLAVALVDGSQVLWTQGFGHLDRDGSAPVDADTLFSVQSMSKLFTATAVMRAVQDGRLLLDEPITTYVPDFTVHSAFEDHPERRITLRMLLGHTAGFTHEAPIGNNDEVDPGTFDDHVGSISDTWLRFPVGTGYAYSNLGMDVAGYILEQEYGRPFATVMRDLVLGPVGMTRSTFDRREIGNTSNRALGHSGPIPKIPVYEPMTAAGGLYASASDLARFLRFQLSEGSIDGRSVLDPALIDEMRTVPAPHAGAAAGYALGVTRHRWVAASNTDLFDHGGGGFGFLSDLWWAPKLQLGIAVLTNSSDHHLQGDLALSILLDLVQESGGVYRNRLLALPARGPAPEPDGAYLPPDGLAQRIADLAMPPSGDEPARWARYAGDYAVATWGIINPLGAPERFVAASGVPYFEGHDQDDAPRVHRLTEIDTGVFLADNGETLDFRASVPTWRNFELVRVSGGPAPWQWALLAGEAVAAAWWLIAALVAAIRRRRVQEPAGQPVSRHPMLRLFIGATAAFTAAVTLGVVAMLAAIPGLVDSGFLGWLEFPLGQRLLLHLPLALTVAAGCLVVLTALGWTGRWWGRALALRYVGLAAAGVALVGQLAAWHLIGFGLT